MIRIASIKLLSPEGTATTIQSSQRGELKIELASGPKAYHTVRDVIAEDTGFVVAVIPISFAFIVDTVKP